MRLFVKQVFYPDLNLKSIRKRLYLETSALETLKPLYEPSHGAGLLIHLIFTRIFLPALVNQFRLTGLRRVNYEDTGRTFSETGVNVIFHT